ncbi:MAG: TnpV protein [Eubacteriales bacterium]
MPKQNGYQVPNLRMDERGNDADPGPIRKGRTISDGTPQGLYNSMLLTSGLWAHLTEIDRTAREQMDSLVAEMAKEQA